MEHSLGRGFLASMLGAATGTVLALAMGHFWLIGTLVGGLVGYMSYHVEQVVAVAPRVWKATVGACTFNPRNLVPSRESLIFSGWVFLAVGLVTQTVMSLILAVIVAPFLLTGTAQNFRSDGLLFPLFVFPFCIAALAGFIVVLLGDTSPGQAGDPRKDLRYAVRNWNIFSAVIHIAVGLYHMVTKFLPRLLREIYSEPRLIAGVSALLGAVAGWQAHNWLIGALAGGMLYHFQHQYIYKRMKLAKTR